MLVKYKMGFCVKAVESFTFKINDVALGFGLLFHMWPLGIAVNSLKFKAT